MDRDYWEEIYTKKEPLSEPSNFCKFSHIWLVDFFKRKNLTLLEIGSGDGRDAKYFVDNGFQVTAVEQTLAGCKILSERLNSNKSRVIRDDFTCEDFFLNKDLGKFDCVYSRFTFHAITEKQENKTIKGLLNLLKPGGVLMVEVRSVNDTVFGKGERISETEYYFDNHYRRFQVLDILKKKFDSNGYQILYAKEDINFAPWGEDNPPIIRVIVSPNGLRTKNGSIEGNIRKQC